jgi:hypothetical protein
MKRQGGLMSAGISDKTNNTTLKYPLKNRLISALLTFGMLLIIGLKWPFDPAKIIAICVFSIARLFELRGRWSIFLHGVGAGDLLLYVASAGYVRHP